jgi:hypothetical protein
MTIALIITAVLLSLYIQHKVHKSIINRLNKEKTAMSDENKRLSDIILSLKDERHLKTIANRK